MQGAAKKQEHLLILFVSQVDLTGTFTTHDGKKIYDYTTVPEKRGNNEYYNDITRIGVICHELTHILDMPDYMIQHIQAQDWGIFVLWHRVHGTVFRVKGPPIRAHG
jgi:hypothetical protein